MHIFIVLLIAISLSMDAFSLSLLYGTLNLKRIFIWKLSIIVASYHFFMPLLGHFFGKLLFHILPLNPEFIVSIILCFIGIQMILESLKQEKEVKELSLLELLMFGFAVSMDSFSVGIGLSAISNHLLLCSFAFSICSGLFTFLGLNLGRKLNSIFGMIAPICGGIILIILGVIYGL